MRHSAALTTPDVPVLSHPEVPWRTSFSSWIASGARPQTFASGRKAAELDLMDSWEWNKIAGAVLGTLIFILVVSFAAEEFFKTSSPAKPGYAVEVPEAAATQTAAAPVAEPLPDFGTVLPAADLAHGKEVAGRCQQCHDEARGGPNKIGPNLWGIAGRARATHPGFDYSSAMKANHDPWTFDRLFRYLKAPQQDVPGTKMSFAGLRSTQDRIDLIAYLRTLSDNPLPIPPKAK
jgi:cytochrome c